jgi:thiamine-phosphate pyrophosphorylase
VLLYYITDRRQLAGDEDSRRKALLHKVSEAAAAGVDYIQLRERDLSARELEILALETVKRVRDSSDKAKLLVNSRVDVAIAAQADGVHLRSDDIPASEARAIWSNARQSTNCVIAQSCHSLEDILKAEGHGADFVVFGPVFGKQGSDQPPLGTTAISRVVSRGGPADPRVEAGQALRMPVVALGGITTESAPFCVQAGAAGVAAIRMFQQGAIVELVRRLRSIKS